MSDYMDKEITEQGHEEYCWVFVIRFKQRTENSCNCNVREKFREEFYTRKKRKG